MSSRKVAIPSVCEYETCIRKRVLGGTLRSLSRFPYGRHSGALVTDIISVEPDYILWVHINKQRVTLKVFEKAILEAHKLRGGYTPQEEKVEEMSDTTSNELTAKKNELLMMLREDYLCCGVKYKATHPEQDDQEDQKEYTYKYHQDMKLEEGDLVVVPTGKGDNKKLTVARVTRLIDVEEVLVDQPGHRFKWIIQTVDFTEHDKQESLDDEIMRGVVKAQRKSLIERVRAEVVEMMGEVNVEKIKSITSRKTT